MNSIVNLLGKLPKAREDGEEIVDLLLRRPDCRIERIISHGQSSPEGFWYDQNEDEWVLLLSGEAVLEFEESGEKRKLATGDSLLIPAGCRHRVEQTASPTVWLTVWAKKEANLD